MARKCGTCGNEGHDSRNCPDINDSKEWKEIQKKLSKPKVIHIGNNGGLDDMTYKCGEERIWWAEKYMTDDFAKKLSICEKCKNA